MLGQCAQHSVEKHGSSSCYTQTHRKKLDRVVVRPMLPHIIAKCYAKGYDTDVSDLCVYRDGLGFRRNCREMEANKEYVGL